MNEQMELQRAIDAMSFAMQELRLYLDTHPADTAGIALFNQYANRMAALQAQYQRLYGPLDADTPNQGNTWRWINDPWPWEAAANAEV